MAARMATPSLSAAPERGLLSPCNAQTNLVSTVKCTLPNNCSPSTTTSSLRSSPTFACGISKSRTNAFVARSHGAAAHSHGFNESRLTHLQLQSYPNRRRSPSPKSPRRTTATPPRPRISAKTPSRAPGKTTPTLMTASTTHRPEKSLFGGTIMNSIAPSMILNAHTHASLVKCPPYHRLQIRTLETGGHTLHFPKHAKNKTSIKIHSDLSHQKPLHVPMISLGCNFPVILANFAIPQCFQQRLPAFAESTASYLHTLPFLSHAHVLHHNMPCLLERSNIFL